LNYIGLYKLIVILEFLRIYNYLRNNKINHLHYYQVVKLYFIMCHDFLDCIGVSFTWISGPVKTLLYSTVVCLIIIMILFILALAMKIKLSLTARRALLLANVNNLAHASIILTEKLNMPVYDAVIYNNYPLFDSTVYDFARQIVQGLKLNESIHYQKNIKAIEPLHNCHQGIIFHRLEHMKKFALLVR